MNDLYNYLSNKCLETVSAELVKQAILEDMTLSSVQKKELDFSNKHNDYCEKYV